TTSTTLAGTCQGPFGAIACQLAQLIGEVAASDELGAAKPILLNELTRARNLTDRAQAQFAAHHLRKARTALRHARRAVLAFRTGSSPWRAGATSAAPRARCCSSEPRRSGRHCECS